MQDTRRLDEQFLAELDDTLSWAAEQGTNSHSRFHTYKRNIEWLRRHDREDERAQIYAQLAAEGRLTEILSTMTETIELIETIPVLREKLINVPAEVLKKAFSGPADAFQEDGTSSQARNAMFELKMAAAAARAGLEPKLSSENPDVSFQFEKRRVQMECKRVLSPNKVMSRLHEGTKQLRKTFDPGSSDVGVVAISISKLLNQGDRFVVAESPNNELSDQLTEMLRSNEQALGSMREPAVKAFLFYLSSASYTPNKGYTLTNSGTVFPLDTSDQLFLRRLTGTLRV